LSFYSWDIITPKRFVGFGNYKLLFTRDILFLKSLWNTFIFLVIATPISIFAGLLLASRLFYMKKWNHFFQTVNFFPYITTQVAIGFIFAYMFDYNSGYINTLLKHMGIILDNYYWLNHVWSSRMIVIFMIIWRSTGYYMTIYLAGMTAIPTELYEAARVDGASQLQIFFKITIPQLKNITMFLTITSITGGLQLFDEPFQLFSHFVGVGGPKNSCLTVLWHFYDTSFGTTSELGFGATISVLLFLIIFIASSTRIKSLKSEEV
jgi:multiple sugar transport system permease protein/cellobiose transport system permease protein